MQVFVLAGGWGHACEGAHHRTSRSALYQGPDTPLPTCYCVGCPAKEPSQVLYSIGYLGDQIRAFVGDGSRWNLEVSLRRRGLRAPGDRRCVAAGRSTLDLLEDRFLVLYGDSYLTASISSEVAAAHQQGDVPAL